MEKEKKLTPIVSDLGFQLTIIPIDDVFIIDVQYHIPYRDLMIIEREL